MLTTAAQQSLQEMRVHVRSGATHKARARGGGGRCPGSQWEHQQGKKRSGCKGIKRTGCKGKKRLGFKWGVDGGGEGEEGGRGRREEREWGAFHRSAICHRAYSCFTLWLKVERQITKSLNPKTHTRPYRMRIGAAHCVREEANARNVKNSRNAPHPPTQQCCTFESLFGLCFESLFWGFVSPLSQFRTRSEREKTSDSKLKIQVRTAK